MAPSGDPLDWTVDEVVQFLCHNPDAPWSLSSSKVARPDPVTFEAALRENVITGEVLLHDVDIHTLKDDLGLKALGPRSSMQNDEEDGVSLIIQPDIRASSSTITLESHKRPRPGEHTIFDKEGKKRRRLDLCKADGTIEGATNEPAEHPSSEEWYMGPDPITPSQLFYPAKSATSDDEFSIIGSQCPPAKRKFVNKCMSHFYRQRPVRLGPNEQAVIPYHPAKGEKIGQIFFTLYTYKHGHVTVSKQDLRGWPQLKDIGISDVAGAPKSSDPFAWLIDKYPVQEDGQDAFPLYGDSGSEGDYDEETWREIDEEFQASVNQKRAKLTPDAVNSIIERCILNYETEWQQIHKPREEHKARAIWRAATRSNSRNQQIKVLTGSIKKLEARLTKLRDAIKQVDYSSESELQTQCQTLQQTVFQMQKYRHQIFVIGLESCPPKIAAPPRSVKFTKRRNNRGGDSESLDSDSDDDFIDDSGVLPPPLQPTIHGSDPAQKSASSSPSSSSSPSDSSSSSSDDEGDIISVSGTRRRFKHRRHPFAVSSSPDPAPVVNPNETLKVIDLTGDSPHPDEFDIATPPLNPVQVEVPRVDPSLYESMSPVSDLNRSKVFKREGSQRSRSVSLPDIDDYEALRKLDYSYLEERRDPRRLLAKLIGNLTPKDRLNMAERIPSRYEEADLRDLTVRALELMLESRDRMEDMEYTENLFIMRAASFYISWVTCSHLTARGIRSSMVRKTLRQMEGYREFYKELSYRLAAYCDWERNNGSEQTGISDTPHRTRKRAVKESEAAKSARANAQRRVAVQENSAKKYMESMGAANTDHTNQVVSFGNPPIHLHQAIARLAKPHQLQGIQFMWRELIADETHQGCLLAHTMGLGKTMQVISLLVTISTAAHSPNPDIVQQVPEQFRRSQTLVLCPSSLTENWHEELHKWTPPGVKLGPFFKFTSNDSLPERLETVRMWYEKGGILLLSYDMFRNWIMNKETMKRSKPLTDTDHEDVKGWLLDGPNIVIADEAHRMKNSTSGVALAAMQIKTKSRVALTGSPLANNLTDYYAMVNWVAEGYLGDAREFQANYVEPIEEGLYVDSTYTERRRSLVRLKVLKENLEPKINRADISVLAGSLPPKVEFVITVPLTDVQQAAYNSYVASILQGRCDINRMEILAWLAVLGLCCNHPACFRDKLLSRFNDAQRLDIRMEEVEKAPGDEPISQLGLDLARLQHEQEQIYSAVPDIKAVELSHRARIVHDIIAESVRVGDKVLVFSHSLLTLDYVEGLLRSSGWKYSRLDGQTPVSQRQGATKRFNGGSPELIYLISTRAGGLGLNIPGANRVIIFDFTFNPVWEEQAVGRAYRLGQQKPVFVYRFLSGGTFEEVMYNKTVYKTQLAFRVVDKKNPVRWASKKLGEYLFPVKDIPHTDVSEYFGKDPEVLDKILEKDARSDEKIIRKIGLTETFQKEDNDKLTEEEKREVLEELSDERLRRLDPAAWQRRMDEKQRIALGVTYSLYQQHMAHPSSMHITQTSANLMARAPYPHQYSQQPPPMPQPLPTQPTVSPSAHNVDPPAFPPDFIHFQSPGVVYNPLQPPPPHTNPIMSHPYSQPATPYSATMDDGFTIGGDAEYYPRPTDPFTAVPVQTTASQSDGSYSPPPLNTAISVPVQAATMNSDDEYFPPSPNPPSVIPVSGGQEQHTIASTPLSDNNHAVEQHVATAAVQDMPTLQQRKPPTTHGEKTSCKPQ
ncbi:putative SNF2 family helicase/ATPase [Aspergillus homomorphus CBS 101889]|uniref:SNF2 family helicase/ATPase n=1 Tax=Aspergillus homomorphus (strain CBS 101889) TaxID=1450537 RepID=A0A395HRH0_ASPHC|nr:hypothetical protein BO97DRAFT_394839 [Aspergillus homomorphus CBS 101889]RAL10023.1 hypothetical protein BO97DRAFT_394839 [Aspergillus homomorphus CBS 101889]